MRLCNFTIVFLYSKEDIRSMKMQLSFWSAIKLNAPEWKSIAVGCVCATVIGLAMPLFVLVFGHLFGVRILIVCLFFYILWCIVNLFRNNDFDVFCS